MAKDVNFKIDTSGGAEILQNNKEMLNLEIESMNNVLGIVEAEFMNTFGFQGKFKVVSKPTKFRSRVLISGDDKRTANTLMQNPKWLDQFVENMTI